MQINPELADQPVGHFVADRVLPALADDVAMRKLCVRFITCRSVQLSPAASMREVLLQFLQPLVNSPLQRSESNGT